MYICIEIQRKTYMKKFFVLPLMIVLLLATQHVLAVVASEYCFVLVDNTRCNIATIDESVCDNDTNMCDFASDADAMLSSKKKSHQLKKDRIFKNKNNHRNQTATIFQGIYFCIKLFFDVYSGEKAYLLTGGDERSSC